MPQRSTLILVAALVIVAIGTGLLISGGFDADDRSAAIYTPAPVIATAGTATPAATATLAATATRTATATSATTATRAATATVTPSPQPTATFVEYTVQQGDTLISIARRYGVSVEAILAINDLPNPARLTIGTTLRIPAAGTNVFIEHTVQQGDTLISIARRYGVSVDAILAVNAIPNPRSLTVGAVIRIPRS